MVSEVFRAVFQAEGTAFSSERAGTAGGSEIRAGKRGESSRSGCQNPHLLSGRPCISLFLASSCPSMADWRLLRYMESPSTTIL